MNKAYLPLATLLCITIAAILTLLQQYEVIALPAEALTAIRWTGTAVLLLYGLQKRNLTTWILISMVVGAQIGYDFPQVAQHLNVLSKVFLKLIKTIIAPLIFATLVVGIAGHANLKQIGSMGWKAILYFEIVTTLALFIGLAAINISKAGEGINMAGIAETEEIQAPAKQTWSDIILHVFPENIAKSVAEGQVLQIVVFSVIFAIGLAMVSEHKRKPMLDFCESLSETMFKFTNIIMYFAPIGVGAAIAYTVGHMGFGILVNLFQLLATLYVALLAFVLLVLLPVALIARIPIVRFLKAISGPVSIAFATTSSEAALPRAMEEMEKLGVPRRIVAFVMPTGYSFNLDGTTLYLALAAVFVAQAAGIDLTWEQQLLMVFTLMLTSKGVAGVPRASLVILLGTVASFNLPVWPLFAILGIDELMDMARTSINVTGNCLATAVVARWEGEFDLQPEVGLVETSNPELLERKQEEVPA
ncbi:cation:dicarboxylase symporter family transporter [Pontibacter sp. FD36]|uniref:dicarboxylate/amino acid:cation symporter n=1 Tax=Pontibacter sp. FD36 TaxID=2789860 RepID=UPI0018ABFDA8|nr:cation:dicarboxylase symporter family transporter [Pontibacter sp. FD36]MBF8963791.1 cation:dicarboxylase symporter family transporter [Pontibacter sp. FD36]